MSETDVTIGAFLREKVRNMLAWLSESLGSELPWIPRQAAEVTEFRATYAAEILNQHKARVQERDWTLFADIESELTMKTEFWAVLREVKDRPELHEKFWRYIDLFVEIASIE
jgi:hypothetical protein